MNDVMVLKGPPRFDVSAIRRVVRLACERVGAERALLFGSYARGTADAFSDVDLLLVCVTDRPFLERFRLFLDVLQALPGCELLVYTPAEVAERQTCGGVVEQALRDGVVLYDRPPH